MAGMTSDSTCTTARNHSVRSCAAALAGQVFAQRLLIPGRKRGPEPGQQQAERLHDEQHREQHHRRHRRDDGGEIVCVRTAPMGQQHRQHGAQHVERSAPDAAACPAAATAAGR